MRSITLTALLLVGLALVALDARGADGPAATLQVTRITSPIRVDGDLSDEGWSQAAKIETWFEVNPGDNTPSKVKNIGHLAYDDRFVYVGMTRAAGR
jgi:hypothetical protein